MFSQLNRLVYIWILSASLSAILPQPLSGSYTVGGINPHFETLMEAKYALMANGISGPVFFNIRPGIYTENGGNNTVLEMDSVFAGVSETNRITFQPDEFLGGDVNNVRLQMNRTNSTVGKKDLIRISVDYVTIRNLTLEDVDSSHTFDNHLIRLSSSVGNLNLNVDGFILEGCKLIGTSSIQSGSGYLGTDFGIGSSERTGDIIIKNNTFIRLLRAVSVVNGTAVAQGTVTVEDNTFLAGYRSMSGTGNLLGACIEVSCTTASIRRNVIDFSNTASGGLAGITLRTTGTGVIEKNIIKGVSAYGIRLIENSTNPTDSLLVANNMVTGSIFQAHPSLHTIALEVDASNTTVIFNTLVIPPASVNSTVLRMIAPDCKVINNIVMMYGHSGFDVVYDQGTNQSLNLQSDNNILLKAPGSITGPFAIRNGVQYPTLSAYQTGTGLDPSSISMEVDVLNLNSDLHLTECQGQDPNLAGIPYPAITDDVDGDVRSTVTPLRGADEPAERKIPLFGDIFSEPIPGFITDVAAGKFDNLLVDGLAIADYTNSQVRLYHNLPSSRSFELVQTISPGFRPTNVQIFDLDDDSNPDLIVSGDTSLIRVYWGNGAGGFPTDTTIIAGFAGINEEYTVVTLGIGEVSTFPGTTKTILVSAGPPTSPVINFMGYIDNTNGRSIRYRFVISALPGPSGGQAPDTIAGIIRNLIGADLDNNGDPEAAAILGSGFLSDFIVFNDTDRQGSGGNFSYGTHYKYSFGASSYVKKQGVIPGDFDGDTDIDLLVTAESTNNIIYLRNEGNFQFSRDTIAVNSGRGIAALDYDGDSDLDFATSNFLLDDNGITIFLNDGTGGFNPEFSCFSQTIAGLPLGILSSDFDLDGKVDLALASANNEFYVLYNFGGGITGINQTAAAITNNFRLEQNYPNPFNPVTTIRYSLAKASPVNLTIYNILGEKVTTLVNEERPAGSHSVSFNAVNLSSGIYFYRLEADSYVQAKKMVIVK